MSSGSLRDRLREATTREILDAAETVLAEQGVAAASMASIAQHAGVSVGTLYNYFKDKDQLLAAILSARRQEFSAHLDQVAKDQAQAPYAEHLSAFVRAVFQVFDQYAKFLRIVIEHNAGDNKRKTWLIDRMVPIVAKAVAEGRLDAGCASTYAAMFAGAISGVLALTLDRPEAAAQAQADSVISFFLRRT